MQGHLHPISHLIREANAIFYDMGFTLEEGSLIESERYNFDVLNVPKDHPARDMQDTFFIQGEPGMVLRTHTTSAHLHYLEEQKKKNMLPPYRGVAMGKVFRNEATDMTHEAEFFQIDGFVISEEASLAELKGTLEHFFTKLMHGKTEIRFRPSFFPFTEPSVEVDMRVTGENAPEKLRDRWIEIMGAGMLHPNVLRNYGIDPEKYRGFAFGGGLDRLAMLRWGIDDVRLMHSADLRFINQF
ncbi:phenylalanine--tRNA ligase subunit alpha [Candidatus Kaiserbacteria bacterium RIFCSPHIGHO2_01_FULL_51_33]|uniref:phenylalanine--tRNA ligase n=1 Tax=Candidatus Kaiserbacteria bacterium RIFCSPLOWO2_01_FULL_51_21 TaxID=1798508 RepID=A0A1F6ECX4_9BACT|nr:MAG: phenylalanine--tRNA ligase subunit alpha [Candidatus Kaiserbacteria bacterium RIFCSPHIGHO2_01_FULL_51_33]OGG71535.1 MAG: phenylalanine--tRNA ligase subunit alpha [Candidatus Kaiserbacteria bacterium RIFCSPLOWO2_01_FULL_51_21]